jgi:hypothetical protein
VRPHRLAFLFCLAAAPVHAGQLDKFGRQFDVPAEREKKRDNVGSRASDASGEAAGAVVSGFLDALFSGGESGASVPPPEGHHLALELGVHNVSRSLYGGVLRGRLNGPRMGLDLDMTGYSEEDHGPDATLFVGRAALLAPVEPAKNLLLFAGAGLFVLSGANDRTGPLGLAGFEWRPKKPLFIGGDAGVSSLRGVAVWDLRAGAGVLLGPFRVKGGWRDLRGPSVNLAGPEVLLGLAF